MWFWNHSCVFLTIIAAFVKFIGHSIVGGTTSFSGWVYHCILFSDGFLIFLILKRGWDEI